MKEHRIKLSADKEVGASLYEARGNRLEACLVLGHGAGAGQTSHFMREFATGLASRGIEVLTFNFPYIEARRKIPDRPEVLEACFQAATEECRRLTGPDHRMYIGGKSLGGRMASHLAARQDGSAVELSGLILLGYPLHPPGKPEQLRTKHLAAISVPTLVVQGTRDPFGRPEELAEWFRRPEAKIYPVPGGDHSFKVPKGSGKSQSEVFAEIQDEIARWIAGSRL